MREYKNIYCICYLKYKTEMGNKYVNWISVMETAVLFYIFIIFTTPKGIAANKLPGFKWHFK